MSLGRAVFSTIVFLPALTWGVGRVSIVRSSKFPLYEQIVDGFSSCSSAEIVGDVTFSEDDASNAGQLGVVRGQKPDVLLTLGTSATRFVREKESSIPSVFGGVIDPIGNGLTPPGVALELDPAVQVRFLHRNFPTLRRVGVLYNVARNVGSISVLKKLQSQGDPIVLVEVPSIDKLDAALRSLSGRVDCLLMVPDPVIYSPQTAAQLILTTLQMGMPFVAISLPFVKAGAMVGIYPDVKKSGCDAARMVDKVIAKGAPAGFVWPDAYAVSVNLIVAGRLKVAVPASVIQSAEQVVQ